MRILCIFPQNCVGHSDALYVDRVTLLWISPEVSVGDVVIRFVHTVSEKCPQRAHLKCQKFFSFCEPNGVFAIFSNVATHEITKRLTQTDVDFNRMMFARSSNLSTEDVS